MNLEIIIKNISKDWIAYRNHCEAESTTGAFIHKVKQDHIVHDLVTKRWKEEISKVINLKKYTVESSLGKGNLVAGPWLVVMDKSITEAATEGYYVAYLFSRSARKLFLSIGIGGTQFQDIYGMKKEAIEKIDLFAKEFSETFKNYKPENTVDRIDLLEDHLDFEKPLTGSSRNLNLLFEKGSIFSKEYNIDNINESELKNDIKNYIKIYDQIVKDPKSDNFDIAAETFIKTKNKIQENNSSDKLKYDYEVKEFEPRERVPRVINKSTIYRAKRKKRAEDSKTIGLMGEEHVYNYEYLRLLHNNRKDLAEKVYKNCDNNDFPGWDITSYHLDGSEKFIEVKSSKKSKKSFTITSNEWDAAKKEKDKYYIYIVNNALTKDIKINEIIRNPIKLVEEDKIILEIAEYDLKI